MEMKNRLYNILKFVLVICIILCVAILSYRIKSSIFGGIEFIILIILACYNGYYSNKKQLKGMKDLKIDNSEYSFFNACIDTFIFGIIFFFQICVAIAITRFVVSSILKIVDTCLYTMIVNINTDAIFIMTVILTVVGCIGYMISICHYQLKDNRFR